MTISFHENSSEFQESVKNNFVNNLSNENNPSNSNVFSISPLSGNISKADQDLCHNPSHSEIEKQLSDLKIKMVVLQKQNENYQEQIKTFNGAFQNLYEKFKKFCPKDKLILFYIRKI